MRVWAACLIMSFAAGAGHAETFTYACKIGGSSAILKIDDGQNSLSWRGKAYKTKPLGQDDCPRYGLRATRPGERFDFCTATKGYADFDDLGSHVVCQQVAVPEDYLGHWALVSEKAGKCEPDNGPAEVTTDNIQTYHEDYCSIIGVKEIPSQSDPRTEITCMAGGEGEPETRVREVWRLKSLFGKQVFLEQGNRGILFWQRCP